MLKIVLMICFSSVFVLYFGLLLRFALAWKRMPEREKKRFSSYVKISVIVPVRNEEKHILACLESISLQNYSRELFQVIVVDDDSQDNTVSIVQGFIEMNASGNFQLLRLRDAAGIKAHKKRALTAGIGCSAGELIVVTDGDCVMGPDWLCSIASFFEEERPSLIIGPVAFHHNSSLLGAMQELEFAGLLAVAGASAALGNPLMCNGANLAYSRKMFEEVGGFSGDEIASGDDVLLMKRIYQKNPSGIRFLKSESALVFTHSQETLAEFFSQRKRWASKFRAYGRGFLERTAVLVFLCNLFLIAGLPFCLFIRGFTPVYLILAGGKLIIDFLFLFLANSFMRKKTILWIYLTEQLFYPVYVVLSAVLGLTSGTVWKGRKI
jgi:biofilm PGA synthesis N-glycosyltransferase PgaC